MPLDNAIGAPHTLSVRLRLLAAVALASVAILGTPRTALACLAYTGRENFGVGERPEGAAVGVIVEKIGFNDYTLEIERVLGGQFAARVTLADDDGCHLPVLPVGQRVLIAPYYHYASDAVYYGDLGIWVLDDQDAVIPTVRFPFLEREAEWQSHRIGGVIPTSVQDAIAQMGLLPNTAARPSELSAAPWPVIFGSVLLASAILVSIRVPQRRRIEHPHG